MRSPSSVAVQPQSSRTATMVLTTPAVLSSFTADRASPQPVGSEITWTAVSSGTVPLEYQFERRDGETWSVVQPYSASATYVWTPAAEDVGEHSVRVLVRAFGSPDAFDDTATVDMTIVPPSSSLGAPVPILCASTALEPCLSVKSVTSAALMAVESVATTTTGVLARYSLYTPELSLLAETAETTTDQKPVAYEYVWFGGQPLAQIATDTGTIHWYFNDHLGTPVPDRRHRHGGLARGGHAKRRDPHVSHRQQQAPAVAVSGAGTGGGRRGALLQHL